jgi:hypothetical protein
MDDAGDVADHTGGGDIGRQLPKKEELPPHTPMLTKPFSPDRLIDVIGSAAS